MKKILLFLFALVFMTNIGTVQVSAYSYGDPNEEKVAEAYKQMVEKLNSTPPDFKGAKAVFETVKEELDMHMGTEPSEAILKDIEAENSEFVIKDMQKILVLNIARRLGSIEKDFAQYDTNKKLIAKAFATYKALSPVVQENDASLDESIKKEFDNALQSLGNPGLFGVGKKEPNIEVFKESKEAILTPLQEQFELESLEVGHFSESAMEAEDTGKKEWTDLSKFKNWAPILGIVAIIVGIVIYSIRKKRK